MMRKMVCSVVAVLLTGGVSFIQAAEIEKIEVYAAENVLVEGEFDAEGGIGDGMLEWKDGLAAQLETNEGMMLHFIKVESNAYDVTDLSSGGQARATFGVLNMSIFLYEFNNMGAGQQGVINVSLANEGPINGYREVEDGTGAPSSLSGKAFVDIEIINYTSNYSWADSNVSGMTTNTTNIKDMLGNLIDLTDYSSDWKSGNVTITLSTDESIAIPEPMTLSLLGTGGLLLVRRRRRRQR